MEIDVVIDVVCPWCYVGKRQLDKALSQKPDRPQIRYRPYQLAPDMPQEGMDRRAYYRRKFGDNPQAKAARQNLLDLGDSLGIAFDFESDVQVANTLDAHRLMRWAMSAGCQEAVAEGLMRRYFEEARFLGDHALLVETAEEAGMDADLVRKLLADDTDKALVTQDVQTAYRIGVTGVPTFIVDNKAAISGAQDAETLLKFFGQVEAGTTAAS